MAKICFALYGAGALGGSFCRLGRYGLVAECGCRARFTGGAGNDIRGARNGMRVVPCGLRSCRVRNVSNSTDRKRGIVGNDPRVVPYNIVPYTSAEIPPADRVRSRTFKKISTSQTNQKLPSRAPALNKANQLFALQGRVLLGEVLGERGRFGGRGAPLSRGAPLPPRSFPSPPRPSSLPTHHLASRAGGEGVEKKRAAGGETNAQTRVTAFPNPPRHPPERRRA